MYPAFHRCNPVIHWWRPVKLGQLHKCRDHGWRTYEVQSVPVMRPDSNGRWRRSQVLRWVETTIR